MEEPLDRPVLAEIVTYDLVIPSASRPHLLRRTLASIRKYADVQPSRLILHNDEVFPNKLPDIVEILQDVWDAQLSEIVFRNDNPPVRHGPALYWLLRQAKSKVILYSQDDHEVIRPLPLQIALTTMGWDSQVRQIRFNKRATREYKDTWQGPWYKKEFTAINSVPLTISDHWYFQTGLWNLEFARRAVEWASRIYPEQFEKHCEEAINRYLDENYVLDPRDVDQRAKRIGTFIWGPIGEDRYIQHIGDAPEDWAGDHHRA